MQAGVDPVPDLLTEFLGNAGHPGDDLDRKRSGEILDDVEILRIGLTQVVLDELDDGVPLRLDRPRGERLVQQAAHVAVVGRVHEDDGLLRHLARADHTEVAAARRREPVMILECRGDIGMAGQRIEVLLFVVVDRSFVPHTSIDLVWIVEVLLRDRVEHQLGLCHQVLLGAVCKAGNVTEGCCTVMVPVWDTWSRKSADWAMARRKIMRSPP